MCNLIVRYLASFVRSEEGAISVWALFLFLAAGAVRQSAR